MQLLTLKNLAARKNLHSPGYFLAAAIFLWRLSPANFSPSLRHREAKSSRKPNVLAVCAERRRRFRRQRRSEFKPFVRRRMPEGEARCVQAKSRVSVAAVE